MPGLPGRPEQSTKQAQELFLYKTLRHSYTQTLRHSDTQIFRHTDSAAGPYPTPTPSPLRGMLLWLPRSETRGRMCVPLQPAWCGPGIGTRSHPGRHPSAGQIPTSRRAESLMPRPCMSPKRGCLAVGQCMSLSINRAMGWSAPNVLCTMYVAHCVRMHSARGRCGSSSRHSRADVG